jgi:hypothetical protein
MHFEEDYKCNKCNPKHCNSSAVKKFIINWKYELNITNKYFFPEPFDFKYLFGGAGLLNVWKYVGVVVGTFRIMTMETHESSLKVIFRNNIYLHSLKTECI